MNGPGPIDQSVVEVIAALRGDQIQKAVAIAAAAVRRGVDHPLILHVAADHLQAVGRSIEALPFLESALASAPDDDRIELSLARVLKDLNRVDDARVRLEHILSRRPDHPVALFMTGEVLELLSEPNLARAAYEAAARQPDYPEPLVALGHLLASNGRSDEARRYAERALALRPGMPGAVTVLAMSDLDDRDFAGAERRLRELIGAGLSQPQHVGGAYKLLGNALHGQGRAAEASGAWLEGNRLLVGDFVRRAGPAALGAGLRPVLRLQREIQAIDPARWAEQAHGAPAPAHAFLVGFPRSGTTLLGKILGAHPGVVELEERPTLAAPLDAILSHPGELERLADASEAELEQMRQVYWKRVQRFAPDPMAGRLVLDKMPLNILLLPVIARMYPQARVLFVLRDPRDVVLSCFRQRFRMTAAMAEFASLDQTARFYDAVMGLGQAYRERLPLSLHVHRHEALLADFDSRVGEVLAFLGLDWDDAVRDFGASDGRLNRTPSAPQVARGLYADGMGQWRAYAGPMQAALPILAPWVERFGYGDA